MDEQSGAIDYDLAITLDAEDLAEQGIADAYEELKPHLLALGIAPEPLAQTIDPRIGEYTVTFGGGGYLISGPGIGAVLSWGLATFTLFDIVNRQLGTTDVKLFAINGGNDVFGIFMTGAQADLARQALPRRQDWPYSPTAEPEWFGAFHD